MIDESYSKKYLVKSLVEHKAKEQRKTTCYGLLSNDNATIEITVLA